ncbi:PAS domain-containing protein [Paragemmobacter ruber]|uniref:PAS domain-containing protein n=1 Tax=Paragemmobacter ruber TaxID=1985673 RepID=A0ABW9Y753_9RHOB|nr:PAS domain-containing protein [Rhodobacter ruber]NBE08349.1 PAS domain-containing protein [Rhodobacter ruber]
MARGWTGWQGWQGQTVRVAPSALLRRHWQGLRQGAALPRRDRILPRSIAAMLDHAIMVERRYDGAVLLRYAGMAVNAVHGQDLTGRPLSALFETGMRDRLLAALEMGFSGQRTLDLQLSSERGLTRPLLTARMTLLPLAPVGMEGVTLIGCLDLDGPPILPPRRFRIDRVLGEPLGAEPPETQAAAGSAPDAAAPTVRRGGPPVLVWSGA